MHHRTASHEREAPEAIEGTLDKMTHRMFGNTYQKNFFRVNEGRRCIEYAKNKDIMEGRIEGLSPGTIAFSAISDVEIDESNPSNFSILVPDGDDIFRYQLRAADEDEAAKWKTQLLEWQDHFNYLDTKKKLWIRSGSS